MIDHISPYDMGYWYRGVFGYHRAAEIQVINKLLDYVKPKRIFEFGAYNGMLTLLFGDWAIENEAIVKSLDICSTMSQETKKKLDSLPVEFRLGNEYDQEEIIPWLLKFIQSDDVVMLYCDGGNKPQEIAQWNRFLKKGDCVAFHDYRYSKKFLKERKMTEFEHVESEYFYRIIKRDGLDPIVPLDAYTDGMHVMACVLNGSNVSSLNEH